MGTVDAKVIKTLKRFKKNTARRYHIKRMILFGSQARGHARPNSDIDLMIVTEKKEKEIVARLLDEWHIKQNINYPVDFIDYTDSEFNKLAKGITLVKQVLEAGIEI